MDVFLEEQKAFDQLRKRSVRKTAGRLRFRVAGLRDLERMKRESGRPIDLADIALIREMRKASRGGR